MIKEQPDASVIISVYNSSNKLQYVLNNLTFQSINNFEIIISDDGSDEKYNSIIDQFKKKFKYPVKHLWHSKSGFKKTRILNRAVYRADSEILIFIDGDCIPHFKFVENHIKLIADNLIIAGRRINIAPEIQKFIKIGQLFNIPLYKLIYLRWINKIDKIKDGFYFPIDLFGWKSSPTLLGSNMSIKKKDLLKLNGFNEEYIFSGIGEDTDIEIRANNAGIKILNKKNYIIQYHIKHKINDLGNDKKLIELLEIAKNNKLIKASIGYNQIVENDHIFNYF